MAEERGAGESRGEGDKEAERLEQGPRGGVGGRAQ